ncbi:unnamed protein product [Arabis nemorensis]|uniref:Uncharacterized protein n=1 Tax=Arabis nemorensis TaxID=586526 RepID=A0A565CK94_9BRAS|nr:unnamed protein product [Arabis nemorensis]
MPQPKKTSAQRVYHTQNEQAGYKKHLNPKSMHQNAHHTEMVSTNAIVKPHGVRQVAWEKKVKQDLNPTAMCGWQANDQDKCSAPKTSNELTCYRCKVQKHIAKAYPTRDGSTKIESEHTHCHNPQVSEVQNLVEDVDNIKVSPIPKHAGTCALEDFKDRVGSKFRQSMLLDQIQNQAVLDTALLKPTIEKDDSVIDTLLTKDEPTESSQRTKVQGKHNGETNSEVRDFTRGCAILFQKQEHRVTCSLLIKDKPPDLSRQSPAVQTQGKNVRGCGKLVKPDLETSNTSIMHLSLSKEVKTCLGATKEHMVKVREFTTEPKQTLMTLHFVLPTKEKVEQTKDLIKRL